MKTVVFFSLLLTLVLVMISCSSTEEKLSLNEPNVLRVIPFETISKDGLGNPLLITEQTLIAIQNQEDLEKLWSLPTALLYRPEMPEVDFKSHVLLVVATGERPSSGYSIEIDRIEELEDVIRVTVNASQPGEDCMNMTVITTPHHIIKVARPSKGIVFNMISSINHCT